MRVDSVRLRVPYRSGRFAISGSTSTTNDTYVIQVADDGLVGIGEATPSVRVTGVGPEGVEAGIQRARTALDARHLTLDDTPPPLPLPDLPTPVACAVDGALLDLWARSLGRPVWSALGLPRARLVTTATVSLGTKAEMADEARRLTAAGFRAIKVKIGGEDAAHDRARLMAVAAAAPDVPLRVDANEGWDLATARRLLPDLAEHRVEVVEQPLPRDARPGDLRDLTAQAADQGVAHLLDEAAQSPADVDRIGRDRLAHGVVLKLQKAGGLRAGLELLDNADRHGLHVMVGCFLETWAGIALALQLAGRTRWADLDGAWLLAEQPVIPGAPFLVDGVMEAADLPGLGIALDPETFPPTQQRSTLRP